MRESLNRGLPTRQTCLGPRQPQGHTGSGREDSWERRDGNVLEPSLPWLCIQRPLSWTQRQDSPDPCLHPVSWASPRYLARSRVLPPPVLGRARL